MNYYVISILLFSLFSSSSSSSSSSLSSILSLLEEDEWETEENSNNLSPSSLLLSPPFLFLSHLPDSGSADQDGSAGLEPSLLTLNSLLSAVERKIERIDKEEEEKTGRENGLGGGGEGYEVEGGGGKSGGITEEGEEEEEKEKKEREEKEKEEDRKLEAFIKLAEKSEKDSELRRDSELRPHSRPPNSKQATHSDALSSKIKDSEQRPNSKLRRDSELRPHSRSPNSKRATHSDALSSNMQDSEQRPNSELRRDSELRPHSRSPNSKQATHSHDAGSHKIQDSDIRRNPDLRRDSRSANSDGADSSPSDDSYDSSLPIKPPWSGIIDQIKEKLEEIKEKLIEALHDFQERLDGKFHHILGYYLPSNSSGAINEECAIDVNDDTIFAPANKKWFLKMLDSWGKIPDGFFWGNVHVQGMFEECIKMHVTEAQATVDGVNVTRQFWGRYCTVSYKPNVTEEERGEEEEEEEGRGRRGGGGGLGGWERAMLPGLRSGVSLAKLANPLPFTYGTCVPSSCTAEDVEASVAGVLAQDGLEVAGVFCQLDEEAEEELREGGGDDIPEDKAFISIISVFGILAILGTIYEVIVIIRNISSFELLLNFSLLRNMGRVFTYDNGKETGDVITCLPMLRVVTMLWIIICHQYETNQTFIANIFDSLTYQEPAFAQIVTDGWLSVDTFFFMAGLIVTFRLIPYLKSEDGWASHGKTLATVIVRRIVRLAPVILVVALFCASILRKLAHGPNARVLESFSQDTCRKHWWKDPLFVDNILFPDNEGEDVNDCLSHCWYTAVDVQLLALLPIIFPAAIYHELAGVVVLCLLSIASIAAPLSLTLAYDLPPSPLHHVLGEVRLTYMTKIFMAPWCRMAPWLVGVWTGILLRTPRARRIKLNKLVVFIGYIIAIGMGFVLVIGLLPYNRLHFDHDFVARDWTDYPAVNALYGALARPTWALCVAWVVFTCHTGNADFINTILSYPGWLPVSRLTFAMYIVAPVVQIWWATGLLIPTYFNYLGKLFESAGVFAISLLLALILTCLVELPLISTFNLLIPSPAKRHERAVRGNLNKNINDNNIDSFIDRRRGEKIFPL